MNRRVDEKVRRWLIAERADEVETAEAALGELFGALPRYQPSAGFARRVMLRVGAARKAEASPAAPWPLRWLALALLAAAGSVAVLVPSALQPLLTATGLGEVGLTGVLAALAAAAAEASQLLAGAFSLGQRLASFFAGAGELMSSPALAVTAFASLVTAAVSLRLLDQLIARERSLRHASP